MMLACVRALRVLLHIAVGLVLCAAVAVDRGRWLSHQRIARWWSATLLDILNIELHVHGRIQAGAGLVVANHVSWLDIPLLSASGHTQFVAKSEIQNWPVAGWLADACGTFYIRRGKGGAAPLLEKLVPHLREGGSITVFPEGTTGDGARVLPFHARLFAAAVESGCNVQPVALRYGRAQDGSNIAPFIGDDDLVSHLWRVLREPQLRAELHYAAPLRGSDRDALADAARSSIATVIEGLPLPDANRAEWAAAAA